MSLDSVRNVIEVSENGPYRLKGEINFLNPNEETIATGTVAVLCRCGSSQNKPFCDGSHETSGFCHTALILDGKTGEPTSEPLPVNIEPLANGPLFVTGSFDLVSSDGKTICQCSKAVLCRCAHSENKPFCDGSHKDFGFEAPAMGV